MLQRFLAEASDPCRFREGPSPTESVHVEERIPEAGVGLERLILGHACDPVLRVSSCEASREPHAVRLLWIFVGKDSPQFTNLVVPFALHDVLLSWIHPDPASGRVVKFGLIGHVEDPSPRRSIHANKLSIEQTPKERGRQQSKIESSLSPSWASREIVSLVDVSLGNAVHLPDTVDDVVDVHVVDLRLQSQLEGLFHEDGRGPKPIAGSKILIDLRKFALISANNGGNEGRILQIGLNGLVDRVILWNCGDKPNEGTQYGHNLDSILCVVWRTLGP